MLENPHCNLQRERLRCLDSLKRINAMVDESGSYIQNTLSHLVNGAFFISF